MTMAMKISRYQEKDVPGLGEKLKQARLSDDRPLTLICGELGMSTQNWYRIEKEQQVLPIETLKKIEEVLGIDFGVSFDD